jgi:hypothetical protein
VTKPAEAERALLAGIRTFIANSAVVTRGAA